MVSGGLTSCKHDRRQGFTFAIFQGVVAWALKPGLAKCLPVENLVHVRQMPLDRRRIPAGPPPAACWGRCLWRHRLIRPIGELIATRAFQTLFLKIVVSASIQSEESQWPSHVSPLQRLLLGVSEPGRHGDARLRDEHD